MPPERTAAFPVEDSGGGRDVRSATVTEHGEWRTETDDSFTNHGETRSSFIGTDDGEVGGDSLEGCGVADVFACGAGGRTVGGSALTHVLYSCSVHGTAAGGRAFSGLALAQMVRAVAYLVLVLCRS